MNEHKIRVEAEFPSPTGSMCAGFKWVCGCKAEGSLHDEHQTALEFGIYHMKLMNDPFQDKAA